MRIGYQFQGLECETWIAISEEHYRFNEIPIKIPQDSFVDIDNFILKFMWKGSRP